MRHGYLIDQPTKLDLDDFDTRAPERLDRDEAEAETAKLLDELFELQELLWGARTHSVLVVLQGMDAAGKDGTIKSVMGGLNPQGCTVTGFKVPTEEEREHDYLWRIHKATPRRGTIGIFNRSHYECVLVERVHELAPKDEWRARYDDILQFEAMLARQHTIVRKFFLHISKEEQKERFLEREQSPSKYWKLAAGDWRERELWGDYQKAYADAVGKCAQPAAPWIIVPADQKWYRNLVVAEALVDALRPLRDDWMERLEAIGADAKAELEAYRKGEG